jgi:hypothetical protein
MGFNWSDVVVVPDGTLHAYPRFNTPSSSLTPGSLIFPPQWQAVCDFDPERGVPLANFGY